MFDRLLHEIEPNNRQREAERLHREWLRHAVCSTVSGIRRVFGKASEADAQEKPSTPKDSRLPKVG